MATLIKQQTREAYPASLGAFLPIALREEIESRRSLGRIEEIRLRAYGQCALTTEAGNFPLEYQPDPSALSRMLAEMCSHSLYAHRDTIREGYITLSGGIRVGIGGRAATDGGQVIGIYDISSLNIRIPSVRLYLGEKICSVLRGMKGSGVLIYSPPGVGKTTLLRSVAYRMAVGEEAMRVVVVDSRGELDAPELRRASVDILSHYPKGVGIEIASRTMNSQLTVCDEIGSSEVEAIISAQNCGVPLLASAHGDSIEGLLSRSGIRKLAKHRTFGAYVRIWRSAAQREYRYEIKTAEEAYEFL